MSQPSSAQDGSHRKHRRHDSQGGYQESDPYRTVRKTSTPDSYDSYNGYYEPEESHSRTASDSSTSRLATNNGVHRNQRDMYTENDYYDEDPYAIPPRQNHGEKQRKQHKSRNPPRANSYLPYSHYRQDSHNKAEPISLLEDEHLPSFASPGRGGAGSILQDNIAMDTVDQSSRIRSTPYNGGQPIQPLPEIKKKGRRCLGLPGRTAVFIAFAFVLVVIVVWYFVWPRVPSLIYLDAELRSDKNQFTPASNNVSNGIYGMEGQWVVNMTANNHDNWVPLRISDLDIQVNDKTTGMRIGYGKSGSLVLPGRQDCPVSFMVDISYFTTVQNDATFVDLFTACGVKNQDPTPQQQQPIALQLEFLVTYHISGIAWTTRASVVPSRGVRCPTPS
ncbi:hypothetical protein DFQ28_002922 [Apophysomyces sp. BC1034]|nr:hypothetical protein DFQ30_003251 [Apophysomyces sp. BC1015]KAG0179298.1 hypothetical protein DFQ29_002271 [Apophysomyces sp. BC1021]KAG0189762.1 hypothetical protein DFQ28_002922 [Apophysomyces sp. BC1034]